MYANAQVVLVGGKNTRSFKQHLIANGVDVCGEITAPPVRIPRAATAIVFLRNLACHKLWDHCREAAKQLGLLLVAVDQSWSAAKSRLMQVGLIQEETVKPVEVSVSVYDLQAWVLRAHAELTEYESLLLEADCFDKHADELERVEQELEIVGDLLAVTEQNWRTPDRKLRALLKQFVADFAETLIIRELRRRVA